MRCEPAGGHSHGIDCYLLSRASAWLGAAMRKVALDRYVEMLFEGLEKQDHIYVVPYPLGFVGPPEDLCRRKGWEEAWIFQLGRKIYTLKQKISSVFFLVHSGCY